MTAMRGRYRAKKMKDFLKIILAIVVSYSSAFAKEKNEIQGVKDSIAQLSEKLSGEWELIGHFENDQFVEIVQKITHNSTNRDGKEIEILTDSGFIKKPTRMIR